MQNDELVQVTKNSYAIIGLDRSEFWVALHQKANGFPSLHNSIQSTGAAHPLKPMFYRNLEDNADLTVRMVARSIGLLRAKPRVTLSELNGIRAVNMGAKISDKELMSVKDRDFYDWINFYGSIPWTAIRQIVAMLTLVDTSPDLAHIKAMAPPHEAPKMLLVREITAPVQKDITPFVEEDFKAAPAPVTKPAPKPVEQPVKNTLPVLVPVALPVTSPVMKYAKLVEGEPADVHNEKLMHELWMRQTEKAREAAHRRERLNARRLRHNPNADLD